MKLDHHNIEALLHSFKAAGIKGNARQEESNIFEIAGYPHYENVVSNILAFFFDTEEQHGYQDKWVKALLRCYKKKYPHQDISIETINTSNIEREYSNGDDKRIDLLLDCEDFLVLIENKIYASLYNDLDIYENMAKNYLRSVDKEDIPILKIVLSLSSVNNIKQDDVINITYDELYAELEQDDNDYQVNDKWKMLEIEFIESIKRRKANMRSNEDWVKFAKDNVEDINAFLDVYKEDTLQRLRCCKDLCKDIKTLDESLSAGTYEGGRSDPYCSVYLNLRLNDGSTPCIETYVMKRPSNKAYEDYSYVYVALWSREHKSYDYLSSLVNLIGVIGAKKHKTDGWKEQYILRILPLNDVDIHSLANDIVRYAQAILTHQK